MGQDPAPRIGWTDGHRDGEDRRRRARRGPTGDARGTEALAALPTGLVLDRLIESGRLRRDRRRSMACVVLGIDDAEDLARRFGPAGLARASRSIADDLCCQRGAADLLFSLGGGRFAVLKAGGEIGECWAWCEEFRTRVRDTRLRLAAGEDGTVTVSVGLHALDPASFTRDALDSVATAEAVARERGGDQVATWDSVVMDRICDHAATLNPREPAAACVEVCRRLMPRLGKWQVRLAIEHGEHAARLAEAIAARLGIGGQAVGRLRLLARLAALASAELPETVLGTADGLAHGERLVIGTRVGAAARIAARLGLDEADAECLRQCMCRFDSSADPETEPGGKQPRDARIVGAALACGAMLEARPYRPALAASAIVAEIQRESGGQFAPDVAPATISVVRDIGAQPVRLAA